MVSIVADGHQRIASIGAGDSAIPWYRALPTVTMFLLRLIGWLFPFDTN